MSLEDFFANPDSAENQNEISVQPDVDAQTSEQDRIPRSLSDTHERRFRANLVRYYDEETAKIIMEARAQAKKDIAEGRIQNMTEGVSPEFYTDKEMAQDASLKKAHDNLEKQQKRDKARKRRQMPDRYGFKRWQKIAASVLITLVVLGSVTMSTDALRVPIVKFLCLKLLDYPVSILGIIFSNKCFNTGRIKDGHIRFCRVDRLTDRLGNINKVIENKLEVI